MLQKNCPKPTSKRIISPHIISSQEGSLEVKLLTIGTDEKQRRKSEEKVREEKKRKKTVKEDKVGESQKKEDPGARKGRKVAKHCVFPMFCGSLKRRVRSQLAR